MGRYGLVFITVISIALTGCSTMDVRSTFQNPETVIKNQAYQLRVQTRYAEMDKLVYALAYKEFGKYIPIAEKGPYAGAVEVLFFKTSESAFICPQSMFSSVEGYADWWYTKDGYVGRKNNAYTIGETITYPEIFAWQNSTMLVNIKDNNFKRLWSVEYKYRSDGEISSWTINAVPEIANTCIKRVAHRMQKDFTLEKPPIKPTRNYRERSG